MNAGRLSNWLPVNVSAGTVPGVPTKVCVCVAIETPVKTSAGTVPALPVNVWVCVPSALPVNTGVWATAFATPPVVLESAPVVRAPMVPAGVPAEIAAFVPAGVKLAVPLVPAGVPADVPVLVPAGVKETVPLVPEGVTVSTPPVVPTSPFAATVPKRNFPEKTETSVKSDGHVPVVMTIMPGKI